MGLLYNSYFYTVGNLEYTTDGIQWRENIAQSLQSLGIKCFDPNKDHFINQPAETPEIRKKLQESRINGDWDYVSNYMRAVVRRDLRFCDRADFIICHLEPDLPTFGSVWELAIASQQRKPVLFHIDDKKRFSLWLAGLFDMNLVWESWDNLINYVKDIDSGTIQADPKYWKIFAQE